MREDQWIGKLEDRERTGNLRRLTLSDNKADFVSNDYLGLSGNNTLYELIKMRVDESSFRNKNGSGGSRLLSGNSLLYEQTEAMLADVFSAETTLIFNSGYQANLALLSAVPQKGDTIIYDQLSHICLKEGAWLSKADSVMFAHNDMADLDRKLEIASGDKYVAIESVYSMDGDFSPLQEIISVCEKHDARLIIDEAHSTGVIGDRGAGWCVELGLHDKIFARVYTFGKGMGVHGACIACDDRLKQFLINFARPFIYTTALPFHSIISIAEAFKYLDSHLHLQDELIRNIDHFRQKIKAELPESDEVFYPGSTTAIQPIIIPGNDRIRRIGTKLQENNLDVRPILAPTVRKGKERLRISLHNFNTFDEIDSLIDTLKRNL